MDDRRTTWTIYVCPACGHVDAYPCEEPCEGCYDECGGEPHEPATPLPVVVVAKQSDATERTRNDA